MIIDITQTTKISKVYREGSMPLKVEKVQRIDDTGNRYTTTHFSCDTHNVGTHIDVGTSDAVIHPERFIAEGIKFDVSHIEGREIQLEDLDLSRVKEGFYVFFQTNWDSYIDNDERYFEHPEIAFSVIEYLVSRKVNMIGIDAPGLARDTKHGIIDQYLAKEEKYTIENLTHLNQLPDTGFTVFCLPIKMEGLDAWPARLIASVQAMWSI